APRSGVATRTRAAGVRARRVRAGRECVTAAVAGQTFVDVGAGDAVTRESRLARAGVRARRVRADGVGAATTVADLALVEVDTLGAAGGIPPVATAGRAPLDHAAGGMQRTGDPLTAVARVVQVAAG